MTSLTIEELPYSPDSSPLFAAIRVLPQPVFLDSGKPYAQQGRYDIISAAPIALISDERDSPTSEHYFQRLAVALNTLDTQVANPQQLPFIGGAIGYFSYDLGRQLHKLPNHVINDSQHPIALAGIYTWAIINDHQKQQTLLVAHPQCQPQLLSEVKTLLATIEIATIETPTTAVNTGATANKTPTSAFSLSQPFTPCISKTEYQRAFSQVQRYIQAGDCYQINLAQRFSAAYQGDPWLAYQQLRPVTAAPFSAYLEFNQQPILSLSPERFIQCIGQQVSTAPIKGTRKRSSNPEQDAALAQELLNSDKDRAENLMIVDLLRNDLGKNCLPGSIKVEKLFELQSFETVHHLVSTISGSLKPNTSALDLLAGAFPGGSITGAPKKRAMEIIEELESHRRSAYCGSIGYISCDGHMDTNIAIRTLYCQQGQLHCWAGGGIVADSQCEDEYQECYSKVGKILNCLEQNQ
ncbi:aminodeoxychorismate synthase component I [Dasania sp. GY-MA-18]|uniref:aminodeoxychorismate synthase n=1 Tax=Dasania phycosphaerae TaxID=2950436 RepID=A0A9J6RM51_9GAMM|nr:MULTISPECIES: aminodeoxychorismate synthase component I [Dasania]MCR8923366.1 aminodeoxychorismate synthase component I [Dasania sp. GY-MA-18]MCZ0865798.1 aminodeoxychorismate synthase component I [Dasania phycosphaerae]MCZ0869523.1 aminodeoxychorismate synthase component I [Dasania phycosphaerae]